VSKNIKIRLNYTDLKGEDAVKDLLIRKVFNWAYTSYQEMSQVIIDTNELAEDLHKVDKQLDLVINGLKDGWFEARKELLIERRILIKAVRDIGKGDFFKKRFKLVSGILKDNNIHDEFLHTFDFWDKQVEPSEMINVIARSINKDALGEGEKKPTGKQ